MDVKENDYCYYLLVLAWRSCGVLLLNDYNKYLIARARLLCEVPLMKATACLSLIVVYVGMY